MLHGGPSTGTGQPYRFPGKNLPNQIHKLYFPHLLVVYLSPGKELPCFLYKMENLNVLSTVPST